MNHHSIDYIAAHIKDFIIEGKLFTAYKEEDITLILKSAKLSSDDYITLLEQSTSIMDASKLYELTRNTVVSVNSIGDVLSILKTVRKCMKLGLLDTIIDILTQQNDMFIKLVN